MAPGILFGRCISLCIRVIELYLLYAYLLTSKPPKDLYRSLTGDFLCLKCKMRSSLFCEVSKAVKNFFSVSAYTSIL